MRPEARQDPEKPRFQSARVLDALSQATHKMPAPFLMLLLATVLLLGLGWFLRREKSLSRSDPTPPAKQDELLPAVLEAVQHGLFATEVRSGRIVLNNALSKTMARRMGLEPEQLACAIADQAPATATMQALEQKLQTPVRVAHGDGMTASAFLVTYRLASYRQENVLLASFEPLRTDSAQPDTKALEEIAESIQKPLNSMIGNMALMDIRQFSPEQQAIWNTVCSASDEIRRKNLEILCYVHLGATHQANDFSLFEICETIENSVSRLIAAAHAQGIDFQIRAQSFPIHVMHDQPGIRKMMELLLGTLMEHQRNGTITISICHDEEPSANPMLRIQMQYADGRRAAGREPGLGLAACQRLGQQLRLRLFHGEGEGAGKLFVLEMPCVPARESAAGAPRHGNLFFPRRAVLIASAQHVKQNLLPHLSCWGLQTLFFHHPDQASLSDIKQADCVILFSENSQWNAESENRITENASFIIECNSLNPLHGTSVGRTTLLPSHSLTSIFRTLHHAFSDGAAYQIKPVGAATEPCGKADDRPQELGIIFNTSLKESLDSMQSSIAADNAHALMQELHNIAGALAAYDRADLSRQCIALENDIKQQGLPSCLAALQDLLRQLAWNMEQQDMLSPKID